MVLVCAANEGERKVEHGFEAVHVVFGVRLAVSGVLLALGGALLEHISMTELLELELLRLEKKLGEIEIAQRTPNSARTSSPVMNLFETAWGGLHTAPGII